MSSLEFNEIIPQGGYGIYFEKNANFYTLFADCSGDSEYDSIGTQCNGVSEKISEQSFLNEKIIINNLFSPLSKNALNIVFAPPDPKVYIEPGSGSIAMIFITDPSAQVSEKIITVNKVGLIWIEDNE
jgi:hypothetical protein